MTGSPEMTDTTTSYQHHHVDPSTDKMPLDRPTEKRKLEESRNSTRGEDNTKRRKGVVPIRAEYLIEKSELVPASNTEAADDDAAEAFHHKDRAPASNNSKKRLKNQGQNTGRKFGKSRDEVGLCSTRTHAPELSPPECKYGNQCRYEHDLRKYLSEHKRPDLTTFNGTCPVWEVKGFCPAGWKCRFVGSHSKEILRPDLKKELVLIEDDEKRSGYQSARGEDIEAETGVINSIAAQDRMSLAKRRFPTPQSEQYLRWLDNATVQAKQSTHRGNSSFPEPTHTEDDKELAKRDHEAQYHEMPLRPAEKRRLYFSRDTPVLAPLTTQGNLPFRRLCVSLGASFTYSEMAMSLPLLQGHKPEWALIKAHESELQPPTLTTKGVAEASSHNALQYQPAHDSRFSAQIAANKPWVAVKATEVLTALLPPGALRAIDLNVGCPIDLVYREGAGSALMDSPSKLEKILYGMNAVSGTTPITCKIRMGTRDHRPTAQKLVERLVLGGVGDAAPSQPSGVAAITLHGRSRQQRYTRSADWQYISSTAAMIKRLQSEVGNRTDTIRAPEPRNLPLGNESGCRDHDLAKVYFLGNGDVYTPAAYHSHIDRSGVDAVMIGRGALQKPWIFEEIAAGQMLDKSATERLSYIEQFCRYGLEAWGSDEWGLGTTRRFLLEWLSFACRYVPVGLLERLPNVTAGDATNGVAQPWIEPNIQDRAPAYRGRNDLENLMASDNYKDWIKIRCVLPPSLFISHAVGIGYFLTDASIFA